MEDHDIWKIESWKNCEFWGNHELWGNCESWKNWDFWEIFWKIVNLGKIVLEFQIPMLSLVGCVLAV